MTKRVFKYEVPVNDKPLRVPVGEVVHVAPYLDMNNNPQFDKVLIWVEHDFSKNNAIENIEAVDRYVQVYGTGHEIPDNAEFLGTSVTYPFVWHVYEVQV